MNIQRNEIVYHNQWKYKIDVLGEIAANLNKLCTLPNCYLIISTSMDL